MKQCLPFPTFDLSRQFRLLQWRVLLRCTTKSYITDTHVEDWGQNFKFEGVMSPSSSLRQVLHKCDVVILNCKSACQLSNGSWALINISIPADITDNLPGTKLLCLTTAVSLIFPASRKLRSITGTSGKTDGFTAENLAGYFSGDAKKYACFHTFNANSYLTYRVQHCFSLLPK